MTGDFLKVFALLSWKQQEDKRRLRSASISCPRDAFCQATSFAIQRSPDVDGSRLNKQYCANHTVPKKRKLQPYKRERSYSVAGGVCSPVSSSDPQTAKTRNFSTIFDRKRMINVVVEDFEIEHDIRELWGCCRNRGIFSDTSVQNGFLTTTLCSTELWTEFTEMKTPRSPWRRNLRGYGGYFCPCSCCSVEKKIYRFQLSMSTFPYSKHLEAGTKSGQ